MNKINSKGYMLVEIIVSFSLTFVILISLTNLLLKYKNDNEDLYYSTKYLKDKNLITRNIMEDLKGAAVSKVMVSEDRTKLTFFRVSNDYSVDNKDYSRRSLEIIKENKITKIRYGEVNEDGTYVTSNASYYEKIIEPTLEVTDNMIINDQKGIFSLIIPIKSIYTDESYDIKIFAKRVYNFDINMIVDDEVYNKGYCLNNAINPLSSCEDWSKAFIKLKLKINGEEMFVPDWYYFLEYNSTVELNNLTLYNPTTFDVEKIYDDYSINYDNFEKDLSIYLNFDLYNSDGTYNGNGLLSRIDYYNWSGIGDEEICTDYKENACAEP